MEIGNMIFGNSRGTFAVERGKWQDAFMEFLDSLGFDSYGYVAPYSPDVLKSYQTVCGGFENNVFIIKPYYWGDDDKEKVLPNFVFKPTDYELQWYKYPLRDSYANQDISFAEFEEILRRCKNSL